MRESILADSISFGLPDSEKLHPAEGCYAAPTDVVPLAYGGHAHCVDAGEPILHWRDLRDWTALYARIPGSLDRHPVRVSVLFQTVPVGAPYALPEPTWIVVERNGEILRRVRVRVPWDRRWHAVELELRPAADGSDGRYRVVIEDRANRSDQSDFFGKRLAEVRLAVEADGAVASGSMVPGSVADRVLVDAVSFGVPLSEQRHDARGGFARANPVPNATYGGPPNVYPDRDLTHFREGTGTNAVCLDVSRCFVDRDLVCEVVLAATRHDDPERPPAPTRIEAFSRSRWETLGEVVVPDDGRWHVYRFDLPARLAEEGGVLVEIDDAANAPSKNGGGYYGKRFGSIRLWTDADAGADSDAEVASAEGDRPVTEPAPAPDIALVMAPVWDLSMPPLPVATIAAYLRAGGVSVSIHDFNIEMYNAAPNDLHPMWEGPNAVRWSEAAYAEEMLARFDAEIRAAADRVVREGAAWVGFSVATVSAAFSMRMAELIKQARPETKIVFGGSGLPFFVDGQLGGDWDYLVYGAGERPTLALVRDGDESVRGVIPRHRPETYDPEANRAVIEKIEALPLVDYDGFDLRAYQQRAILPVTTSRGCINTCKYCFDYRFYAPFSQLSGKRAFAQLRHLVERHDRRVFEFSDLLCNGDLRQLRIMCDLLIDAGLDVSWGSFAVMRKGMTHELMDTMRRAGCKYLHYGFESGSQKMLELMGRDYLVADAADTLRATHAAGIRTKINVMVGFPGETDETVQETIDFIQVNAPYISVVMSVNPVYIMASTDLADHVDEYGITVPDGIPDHWEDGTINDAMRRGWVYKVMDAVREAGIPCNFAIMRDYHCREVDPDDLY